MQQQGETEGFERDGAAMALAILSINDVQFLNDLRTNLESTLWRYGFALSPQEIKTVRDSFAAAENSDLSDEEIIGELRKGIEGTEEEARRRRWPY